jgi:hypothetical protein
LETTQLIDRLARDADPIRPLRSPFKRAALWLALSACFVVVVALVFGPGSGVWSGRDVTYWIAQAATAATAITAAIGAFGSSIPARRRLWDVIPLFPLAVWIGAVGIGCLRDWQLLGDQGLVLRADWTCLGPMFVVGLIPAAVLVLMLRRGLSVRPHVTACLGGLAVAAVANLALQTFHAQDLSLMVLVWHVGGAMVFVALAAGFGARIFAPAKVTADLDATA